MEHIEPPSRRDFVVDEALTLQTNYYVRRRQCRPPEDSLARDTWRSTCFNFHFSREGRRVPAVLASLAGDRTRNPEGGRAKELPRSDLDVTATTSKISTLFLGHLGQF